MTTTNDFIVLSGKDPYLYYGSWIKRQIINLKSKLQNKKILLDLSSLHDVVYFERGIFMKYKLVGKKSDGTYDFMYYSCSYRPVEILNTKILANIHTLSLRRCSKLININGLENVSVLDLHECESIKHIINQMNTYELNLTGCNIKNYDALGKVYHLILDSSKCINYLPHGIKKITINKFYKKIANLPSSIKILNIFNRNLSIKKCLNKRYLDKKYFNLFELD